MIEIARILKAQGINGDVKAQVFSDDPGAFCDRGYAYIKQGGSMKRTVFDTLRLEPPFAYLHIDGCDTRNDAEALSGIYMYVEKQDLPEPGEGEYYIFDLVGLDVADTAGNKLGVLQDVLQHGAADVYVVKGEKNFMFPALKRVIRNVNIKARVMTVDGAALAEVAVYDDI
jgi:16S rRNA processing protein RimM